MEKKDEGKYDFLFEKHTDKKENNKKELKMLKTNITRTEIKDEQKCVVIVPDAKTMVGSKISFFKKPGNYPVTIKFKNLVVDSKNRVLFLNGSGPNPEVQYLGGFEITLYSIDKGNKFIWKLVNFHHI